MTRPLPRSLGFNIVARIRSIPNGRERPGSDRATSTPSGPDLDYTGPEVTRTTSGDPAPDLSRTDRPAAHDPDRDPLDLVPRAD